MCAHSLLLLSLLQSACITSAAVLPFRSANGPVISSNFQDPSILQVGNTYYAFSGPNGNPTLNVQVASSSDFQSWSLTAGYDALPDVGPWAASPPHVWAPDVVELSNGQFVLYYSAAVPNSATTGQHCIGAATASTPTGPYTPLSTPLLCNLNVGGAIDPNGFFDPISKNQYVVYKADGNSLGHGGACANSVEPIVPTPVILQQVSAIDGTTLIGSGITIEQNIASDGAEIEAPALVYDSKSAQYVLFFNSGCFTQTSYDILYATSSSLLGPYTRGSGPFLVTGATAANVQLPGGFDILPDGSKAVFHGDLNPGWFKGDGSLRVRGLYAADLSSLAAPAQLGSLQ